MESGEVLPETENGAQFEVEILVETPDSIANKADERITEILTDEIVLYQIETSIAVVDEVIEHGG